MKTLTKRMVSIMLVIVLVFSFITPAFAVDNAEPSPDIVANETGTLDEIQAARKAYFSLSPKAKRIFDGILADTPELLEFHRAYVDKNFTAPAKQPQATIASNSKDDPMTVLKKELSALALPTAVLYSLEAVGVGMVAAVVDGALPVGDILLAAAAASAATVIAVNWVSVSPQWNKIVAAFQKAFVDSANNVLEAFNDIKEQILEIVNAEVAVTVSGKTITVDDTKYSCNTKASELTDEQQKDAKYFPAVLYRGTLYVDCIHKLTASTAKTILKANSSVAGIWATSDKYARGVVGNNPEWHNAHYNTEGYFYHYHPQSYPNAHCWYPS